MCLQLDTPSLTCQFNVKVATKPLSDKAAKQAAAAVSRAGGNQTQAARDLGIGRTTLTSRLEVARKRGLNIAKSSREVVAEPTSGPTAAEQLKAERKKVAELERQLAAARAAGARKADIVRLVKRDGKDDRLRVIWPDLHGSMQDRSAVAAFLADVKSLDPDEGIGLGDIFDAGGFLAERFVWGVVAETEYSFEDDIRAANEFLDGYQAAAPRSSLELMEGNHEARVESWCVTQGLRRGISASFFMQNFAPEKLLRVKDRGAQWFSRGHSYDGLGVHGTIRRGKCLFTHAADLRSFARYGANVVHGHDHQMTAQMFSHLDGTLGLWSMGCLSQKNQYWHHARPLNWSHGYGIQVVARSGAFLTFQIPIINGVSLLPKIKLR